MKRVNGPQWLINALLLAAVLMILSTMLHAQEVRVVKVPQDSIPGLWGQTLCDSAGNPMILILDKLEGDDRDKTLVHEATHVLQMRVDGGCRKSSIHYGSDLRFAFEQELEAYCVEMQVFPPAGPNGKLVELDKLSVFLWEDRPADFTDYLAMKARVADACSKKSPNTPKVKISSYNFQIEHDST